MKKYNDERKEFDKILNCTENEIKQRFSYTEDEDIYSFNDRTDSECYVTVHKKKIDQFALVNADFHFCRPAGSNNYEELLDVARKLCRIFNLPIEW